MTEKNDQPIYKETCIKIMMPYQDALGSAIFNTAKYKVKICSADEETTLIILRPKENKPPLTP